jgi:hypothetical protein
METEAQRAARLEARERLRRENMRRWATSPDNANNQKSATLAAVAEVPPEEPIPPIASLEALRALMVNAELPLHRRIDAAEVVLSYELGAASLAGADPDVPIAAASFKFLQAVASNPEVPEALRFRGS